MASGPSPRLHLDRSVIAWLILTRRKDICQPTPRYPVSARQPGPRAGESNTSPLPQPSNIVGVQPKRRLPRQVGRDIDAVAAATVDETRRQIPLGLASPQRQRSLTRCTGEEYARPAKRRRFFVDEVLRVCISSGRRAFAEIRMSWRQRVHLCWVRSKFGACLLTAGVARGRLPGDLPVVGSGSELRRCSALPSCPSR